MTRNHFLTGMGLGIVAGATIGMALSANSSEIKRKADKAVRKVGDAVNDITDNMGM